MNIALWKDIAERAIWTAIQAFIAVVTVSGWDWESIGAAVLAAVISVVKGVAATRVGDPHTAATIRQ